jgi:hypothetical protein
MPWSAVCAAAKSQKPGFSEKPGFFFARKIFINFLYPFSPKLIIIER